MKPILREAAFVVVVGVTLGTGVGLVWGFPAPPPREPGAACMAPDPKTPAVRWVGQAQAHELLDTGAATFVDARPRDQFQAGHVSGALSVPVGGPIPDRVIRALRGARTVVAYCDTRGGCARSIHLAGLLSARGLPDVRVLEGGIHAWVDNGYPAEAGTCRLCP